MLLASGCSDTDFQPGALTASNALLDLSEMQKMENLTNSVLPIKQQAPFLSNKSTVSGGQPSRKRGAGRITGLKACSYYGNT